MIPELTNRSYPAAVALDVPQVLVTREVLRAGALNLVGGAAALWAATNSDLVLRFVQAPDFVGAPLLFAVIAAALPIQLITVTRPLVNEVVDGSTAPGALKFLAALAVSGGSVLTALAWWRALWVMCAVAA